MSGAHSLSAPAEQTTVENVLTLRFPPAIEARYEAETGPARCRQLIVCGLVALALYDLFLISDWRLVPDVFQEALVVRLGIVTPLALLIVALLLRGPSPFWREASQATISIIVTASILYLTLVSDNPLNVYHHYGIVLVVLFANVVQRLRFPFAIAASIGTFSVYLAAVLTMQNLPWPVKTNALMVLSGACVFTLIGNYQLERQLRLSYLLSLRDRMKHQELDSLSRTDPLTGLGNRRRLEHRLVQLWRVTGESKRPVCVLLLDVDHFKSYNDRYGHPAGDLCLKRISALVGGALRSAEDEVFRFGGEEFLVLLPETDLLEGGRVAERIRHAVKLAGILHEASPVAQVLTVSIGIAASVPEGTITPEDVIRSADAALYAAKRNGRDQVWPRRPALTEVAHLEAERIDRRGA